MLVLFTQGIPDLLLVQDDGGGGGVGGVGGGETRVTAYRQTLNTDHTFLKVLSECVWVCVWVCGWVCGGGSASKKYICL